MTEKEAQLKKLYDNHKYWAINTGRNCTYSSSKEHKVAIEALDLAYEVIKELQSLIMEK